jgi:hypothetical protein
MSSPNRNIFQKKCCDQILAAFGKIARPTPAHENFTPQAEPRL